MDRTAQPTARTATPVGGGRPPRVRGAALAALLGGVLLAAACGTPGQVGAGAGGTSGGASSGPVSGGTASSGAAPSAPTSSGPTSPAGPGPTSGAPETGGSSSDGASSNPADPGDTVSDPVPAGLLGWVFRSTSMTGRDPVAGTPVQISFGGADRVGLDAGCNGMGGAPAFDGSELVVRQVISTMMACEPAAVMQQERWYKDWVQQGVRWSLDGDTLTLQGDGVTVVLERAGRADQPPRPGAGSTDPDTPTGSDGSGGGTDSSTGSGPSTAVAVPPVSPQTPAPGTTLDVPTLPSGKQLPPTTR